ncbi:hypothetical protein GCM10009836_58900 [Pseudonocardia ailaonensis]|uniref:Pilus assembly protein TadE n=1 Tax=Pseudonocardia ailaonensis TaxID=367279 RepID=A0ABN2NJ92_9PSEU
MREAERGAITVEAAIALSVLTLVVLAALGALASVAAAVRCGDAAREMVRLASRGEPERGRAAAVALAPTGATLALSVEGDEVRGLVTAAPVPLFPLTISGVATALLEPGVADPGPAT